MNLYIEYKHNIHIISSTIKRAIDYLLEILYPHIPLNPVPILLDTLIAITAEDMVNIDKIWYLVLLNKLPFKVWVIEYDRIIQNNKL